MLFPVSKPNSRTARWLCLVAFAGAQVIVAPPHIQWRDLLSTGSWTACGFCRSGCELASETTSPLSVLQKDECCPRERTAPHTSERDDSQPDPARGKGCPVCRHVLMAGHVLLAPNAEVVNELWYSSQLLIAISDQMPSGLDVTIPPVRGPPLQSVKQTTVGDCAPIYSNTLSFRRHEFSVWHVSQSAHAVGITKPTDAGATFLNFINQFLRKYSDEELLWTNSKSQGTGSC